MRFLLIAVMLLFGGVEAAAQAALTPVVSASADTSKVLRASPGRMWGWSVTNLTATAGFVMVFNSVTVPADGAVLPLECVALPANQTVTMFPADRPEAFSVGISMAISTTGCFTRTTGAANAFIKALVD